ncbi:VOC family protein [Patescibacteria group bacterium]|nr:VOC family protein [Patescibacteria group bacterium]
MDINHDLFLNKLTSRINKLGIDLDGAKLDHIAFQTSSKEEYNKFRLEFEKVATLVKEPIVGGRRVGVFKYKKPLIYKDQSIDVIELIEPKEGQNPKSGLEHAEYLLPISLEVFIDKYPDIDWNKDNINRDEFPMLILKLSDDMKVKFPRNPILS